MKKIFNAIWKYVAVDGLLHFLVCYAIVITFTLADPSVFPIAGTMVAVFCAFFKEAWDISFKHQDKKATIHDAIFDILGIAVAIGVCYLLK
nr:MAG TPA: putative periplasmic lipoprotein [Caudoviricetes sp.]